ncbi:MAG: 16S rRNA (guanine(527)-N(7))-methyltransferase RsmG [Dehalococcoidales bacterium]|nr:16S rRNA (guanine(527)-N(7))-methyltransferase RsmG [Dehalococcoidales bacterium]
MDILKSGAQKLGINLTSTQLERFEVYYRELVDWNQRMNLTGITSYEEVQVIHFLDSLTIIQAIDKEQNLAVIDVGTGAGLPGIPLKIVLPDIKLTLLEATAKKTRFLSHIVNMIGLDDVQIVTGRAEEVGHNAEYRERYNLVLSRAVAPLPALVELTLPLCVVGGNFIAQKKGDIIREMERARKVVSLMGGIYKEVKSVSLEESGDRRYLIVIEKLEPSPAEYPRRPGIPAKKPII